MTKQEFREVLMTSMDYFVQFNGEASVTDGFKLSIQGKYLENSCFLFERLLPLLVASKCSFKFGTKKLITCDHDEQKHKLLTIYIPNGVEVESFAELVRLNISDYEGGDEVSHPSSYEHYSNAIYFRNDRDENGGYIKAN